MSATATAAPRTRRIETKTIDEVPVSGYKPLDAPWEEFLARLADNPDLAAITRVNLYRREPAANRGWLVEVQEPIDEKWIARNFGGGVYDVKIKQKPDISHYERGIVISGEPKGLQASAAAPAAAIPPKQLLVAPRAYSHQCAPPNVNWS